MQGHIGSSKGRRCLIAGGRIDQSHRSEMAASVRWFVLGRIRDTHTVGIFVGFGEGRKGNNYEEGEGEEVHS